jgi:hypothetical protein
MFRILFRGRALAPLILIGAMTWSFFTDKALAGKVDLPTQSQTGLLAACGKAGGNFNSDDSGFGCDGPGGSVHCTTGGKCTGECDTCGKPTVAHKGGTTTVGVLSGNTLKAGPNTPTKTTVKPIHVKQPVAENNSSTMNNSEHQGKKK